MSSISNIRVAPYGQPPTADDYSNTTTNEVYNPGRKKYGPSSSMGYYDSFADPWSLLWIDKLLELTPEEESVDVFIPPTYYPSGYQYDPNGYSGSPIEGGDVYNRVSRSTRSEPEYDDTGFIFNRKNNWQSGPPVNGYAFDNVVPKAGYWTEAGGPNSEDSKNHFGFQMTTGSDFPILLYNAGHGNVASEGGCQATNVIGWDGYLQADKQGTKDILIGAVHSYSMYTCDLKILDFQDYVDKIEDWLCEQGETEYCNSSRIVPPDTNATKTLTAYLNSLGPQPRTPTIKFIIRVLKMIKKIIEQAQSDGVVGGLLVNWDFICELKNPTTANQYEHGKYNWEGADTPVRYSYTIDLEAQAFIQLLNLRINGMLWHLSSPSGGTRSRVMRLRNFTHIHSNGVTRDIDHASNKRYLQILPHWHADQKPNSILDKQFRFSQG